MSNVGKGPNGYVFTASGEGSTAGGKFVAIGTNSGLTQYGVVLSQGAGAFTSTGPGTLGYVLTSTGSGDPTFQPVSSTGAILTITGNSGGAKAPSASNFNVLGSGSITTVGTVATETIQLTGLTNHALLIGAGTDTITKLGAGTTGQILQTVTTGDPVWSTATYPSTAGTSGNVLTSDGTNFVSSTSTGGGFVWSEITTTSQAAAVGHGYVANNAGLVTITLPASFALGDVIRIAGLGTGLWSLVANTGDIINFGSSPTSAGGSLTATNRYDAIEVVGSVVNGVWNVISSIGNLTVA